MLLIAGAQQVSIVIYDNTIAPLPQGLFGAAVIRTKDKQSWLVVGGSTGSNFDATATREIREIPSSGWSGNWNVKLTMKVPRTECFAILTGDDDKICVVGGTESPAIDIYSFEDYKPFDAKALHRIENNVFTQLCNVTTDINMKPCAAG